MHRFGLAVLFAVATLAAAPGAAAAAEGSSLGGVLRVSASPAVVSHNGRVRVTAHLAPFAETTNRTVTIAKRVHNGRWVDVHTGEVDPSTGNLTATIRAERRTTVMARWAGDDYYDAEVSNQRVISVRTVTRTTVRGNYGRSGAYLLFRRNADIVQKATVAPRHRGHRVRFVMQRRQGARWASFAAASFRLNARSSFTAYIALSQAGVYRTRNEFRGDGDHLGSRSAWVYLRVT